MENDATVSRVGMGWNMASSPTTNTEPTETTPQPESSGVAESATKSATPDRSSLLSADEARTLARIARDRANRFMVSAVDVDFLLDVIARMNR